MQRNGTAALVTLLAALAGSTWAAEEPASLVARLDAPPPADAQDMAPLIHWIETWQTPRPVVFHFLRVDVRSPGHEVFTVIGDDPDGEGPAEARLESPLALAARLNALAAVNANAFRHLPDASQTERARGWFEGKLVDIAGLAVMDSQVRSQPDGSLASFWIAADGSPQTADPAELTQVRQGVSAWIDRLLHDGGVVARPDPQVHPRTLVGVDSERRFVLMVVADGRQKGYSEGISLSEAAQVMKQHGCRDAVNLDGGGSSIMLVRDSQADGTAMRIVNRPSGGRPRPIPVMLGVRRRPAPSGGRGAGTEER